MNIALLLKSELRRSAGILAGMALIIALALSIAVAAGICERMVKASAAQSADDFDRPRQEPRTRCRTIFHKAD